MSWNWLPTSAYGGSDGALLIKMFQGQATLTPEELLAREVIQNSWDAAQGLRLKKEDHDIPFSVEFRFEALTGQQKADFVRVASLEGINARRSQVSGTDLHIPLGSALDDLADLSVPLHVLYLEDYGSHGLHGDPETLKEDSHLFKAMYSVGGTGKNSEGAALGGSFGFGKSAFVQASSVHTVIAHSTFEQTQADSVTRRLVGWTWWPGHKIEQKHFEGRAIFGDSQDGKTVPFVDKAADEVARSLGIRTREPGVVDELGTTFLLLDPAIDPATLLLAVEKYWWPAFIDHLMSVTIVDYDGTTLTPRPKSDSHLAPYIEAYRLAMGLEPVTDSARQRVPSVKWQAAKGASASLGNFALVTTELDLPEDLQGPRVALIRGPRMIIDYKSYTRSSQPIVGVFVASEENNPLLRRTEPPEHDAWSLKSGPGIPEAATKVAKAVHAKISEEIREFSKDFAPPPPPPGQRLTFMAKLLSKFLRDVPIMPPPEPRPISIQFFEPEELGVSGDKIFVTAGIEFSLTNQSDRENLEVEISCAVLLAEEGMARGEELPGRFRPTAAASGFSRGQDPETWIGTLSKTHTVRFKLRSSDFDSSYTIVVRPQVRVLGGAS